MSGAATARQADDWQKVLDATEGHNIQSVTTHIYDDRSWTYIRCSCAEAFTESWEFTDHIRRLVHEALTKP